MSEKKIPYLVVPIGLDQWPDNIDVELVSEEEHKRREEFRKKTERPDAE